VASLDAESSQEVCKCVVGCVRAPSQAMAAESIEERGRVADALGVLGV
jgi:hypothetical protein